jgi:hypothetical protein
MRKTVTPAEVHAWLEQSLGARADIGFRKAIARYVFESPSPFDPQGRRRFKAGFLIVVLVAAAAVAAFLYFDVVG